MEIVIHAHEHPSGPQGFPSVTYNVAVASALMVDVSANEAAASLELHGLTANGARRLLHDARDAVPGGVKYDTDLYRVARA